MEKVKRCHVFVDKNFDRQSTIDQLKTVVDTCRQIMGPGMYTPESKQLEAVFQELQGWTLEASDLLRSKSFDLHKVKEKLDELECSEVPQIA